MRHASPPAYSLLFAFLVMTVIMIIASTTIENTNEKLIYFGEMEGRTQAMLAAQSATELGVLEMKDQTAGYSIDLTEDAFQVDEDGDGKYETWGDYTVYSTAQLNEADTDGYYYTPIPGTGDAAINDDCTVRDTDHDGDFDDDEDPDKPCNWNKLIYGDSVTIPLYYTDSSGNLVLPADFTSFTGWYLKVRTPCADTTGLPDEYPCSSRFEFDGDGSDVASDPNDDDDSVVFWKLVGEDASGNAVTLIPADKKYLSFGSYKKCTTYSSSCSELNTEIYESLVDQGSSIDYIVLEGEDIDPYKELYQICSETHTDYTYPLSTLSLQLSIVQPLIDESGASIPYLEWQLASDASEPFADTKAVIVGEGYNKQTNGIFYYPFIVTRSTTGESTDIYTLSN